MKPSRRDFLKTHLLAGSALALLPQTPPTPPLSPAPAPLSPDPARTLDLAPAQWVWLPAGRTLPNTVLLFRSTLSLAQAPAAARGYLMADSRYRLWVNGQRVQFGPAPHDPRWAEADPIDLTPYLRAGTNVIGAEVLYYGFGDGTWPIGKPGFLFRLDIDGRLLCSDADWRVQIARAWQPGQYKRWYLRSFQEVFDARRYPYDWQEAGYDDSAWFAAQAIDGAAPDLPVLSSQSRDYLYDAGGQIPGTQLRARSIPLMAEEAVYVETLAEAFDLRWQVPADDFFDFDLPEATCFTYTPRDPDTLADGSGWTVDVAPGQSVALTFAFASQHVGFPFFEIVAPAGTVVELLVHEAHQVAGTHRLLNTHFHAWSRFVCREGHNRFETFDYESLRWLQLHLRNVAGEVRIAAVGMRRRYHPFAATPAPQCGDPRLDRLWAACVQTIFNQSQETIVDGMARERQQYSGDIGHILHPLMAGFGGYALAARYCQTYSQGITQAGYFLDCWPAYDRLARIMEREIGMTPWGPLLDHGVGFVFDCLHYYRYSGDLGALAEVYPRLKRFYNYLLGLVADDGLVPVENLGVPVVWIDHLAYQQQRHKHCAFNLYIGAMMQQALAPLATAFGEPGLADDCAKQGRRLVQRTVRRYWSAAEGTFVCNLPWAAAEGGYRYCDRSLATALLYDLLPGGDGRASVALLATRPAALGLSYPTNAVWRYWALAQAGRVDVLLAEFRDEWYAMPSVAANNTLGEFFDLKPDDSSQWSHASVAPLICLYTSLLGARIVGPGCRVLAFEPRLGDLPALRCRYETPQGPVVFDLRQTGGTLSGTIDLPADVEAVVKLGNQEIRQHGGVIRLG
ncbi:MAG: hypothetical protein OHK0039_21400 [Bacteroidia bacterium]